MHEDWRDAYNEWADLDGVKPTLEDASECQLSIARTVDHAFRK